MNITYPKLEPCSVVWPSFVKWYIDALNQDRMFTEEDMGEIPVWEVTFRRHRFEHCPFCGVKLDMQKLLMERHP
jgi:hypothetical protein